MYQKEFEFKFKLDESLKNNLIKKLEKLSWTPTENKERDTYFKKENEEIDENNLQKVLRIRKSDKKTVTFKKLSGEGWIEYETEVQELSVIKSIFKELDYHPFLDIKKERLSGFIEKNIEVNFDQIEKLGFFVELAIVSNKETEDSNYLEKLKNTITLLGIDQSEIIKDGYVQLMIKKQKANL